jgi:DNA modification methylase
MSEKIPEIKCAYKRLVPIKELKAHPKNRNNHPPTQIAQFAKILDFQGIRRPVRVSKLSGFVTVGHGLILAAKCNGYTHLPVDDQDYDNEDMEYADIVADNAIALQAQLDFAKINLDIPDLGPMDIDLLGLKDFKIDIADKYADKDADSVPEARKTDIKIGDLFQLGNHRLLCGDSTDKSSVERLMGGEKADMVFTDPPYGVSFQSNMRVKSQKFEVLENDDVFLDGWISPIMENSSGWCFVWTSWKVLPRWWQITATIGPITNMIVWDKGGGGIGDLEKTFLSDYELALVFNRGAALTGKRLGSVWSIGKDQAGEYRHPTQKPVELASTAIYNCTNHGDIVADVFLGSGSTLIACEKTSRKCFGMEIDPQYCQVIIDRWEKFTGQKAEKI